MDAEQSKAFRTHFYRQLTLGPLEPDDARYVRLYDLPELRDDDPVELLRFAIDANPPPTAQLVSGFRGTGKSTELRRLRSVMKQAGYVVLLCDLESFIDTGQPVEPVDFLYAFVLAVSDAMVETFGVDDPLREGYLERVRNFLVRTEVSAPELNVGARGGGDVGRAKAEATLAAKIVLKDNPSFRERARVRWAGSLGALVAEAHSFIRDLAETFAGSRQTVILIDSVEHIQGTLDESVKVQASIEKLFTVHADMLHFPGVHTVYTVHPYLKIKYANIDDYFPYGGLQIIPTLKIRERATLDAPEALGAPRNAALDAICRVVEQRGAWWNLLGPGEDGRRRLDELILASGGHLRDLMRLLAEVVRRTRDLPTSRDVFDAAINHVRNQALPIADDDALWLAEIARSHTTCLPSETKIPSLARFLDTHRVLCYRNGSEWFDVHPLIRESVLSQAAEVQARRTATTAT